MNFSNLGNLRRSRAGILKVGALSERKTAMSNRTIKVTQKVFARVGMCLLGTAALIAARGNTC